MTEPILPCARLVPEAERIDFLPKHFGRLSLRGEMMVYAWMSRLCADYTGGLWNFYEIENGFYLAPSGYGQMHLLWPDNCCDQVMSADAAGIAVTICSLCQLTHLSNEAHLIEQYHALLGFANAHPEAAAIYAVID